MNISVGVLQHRREPDLGAMAHIWRAGFSRNRDSDRHLRELETPTGVSFVRLQPTLDVRRSGRMSNRPMQADGS